MIAASLVATSRLGDSANFMLLAFLPLAVGCYAGPCPRRNLRSDVVHAFLHYEQACAGSMLLQSRALTATRDHSPILRRVSARIAFPDQVNMPARVSKVLFTAATPCFALFRVLSLHWSSRKYEAADVGVQDRRFDRLSRKVAGLHLEQAAPESEAVKCQLWAFPAKLT